MRYLRRRGVIGEDRIAEAMLAIPREAFLDPTTSIEEAYFDGPVLLKRDRRGGVISTISQPTMIAAMLAQLDVHDGDRVLEIGTASGYNAALLAHLAGPTGLVVTVELEADLAAAAARALKKVGVENTLVLVADGRAGWPRGAPYDGIMVTAGADRIHDAWPDQLGEGGRLVVPLAGPSLCFAYAKRDGQLSELSQVPAAFVRLRERPGDTG